MGTAMSGLLEREKNLRGKNLCRALDDLAVTALMAHVDGLLAEKGFLDHSSCLFRGCWVCILRVPALPQASASGASPVLLAAPS